MRLTIFNYEFIRFALATTMMTTVMTVGRVFFSFFGLVEVKCANTAVAAATRSLPLGALVSNGRELRRKTAVLLLVGACS